MKSVTSSFWAIAALSASMAAFAADTAPGAVPPPPSVKKDCTNLAADARKECEKVAVQMDQSAQGKPTVADSDKPKASTSANPTDSVGAVHHSSPIMTTPDERIAADAVKKGKDPKKALDKVHAKEQQASHN